MGVCVGDMSRICSSILYIALSSSGPAIVHTVLVFYWDQSTANPVLLFFFFSSFLLAVHFSRREGYLPVGAVCALHT